MNVGNGYATIRRVVPDLGSDRAGVHYARANPGNGWVGVREVAVDLGNCSICV